MITLKESPAFDAGEQAYPFVFLAGQRAARLWLDGPAAHTLIGFRDCRWRAYAAGRAEVHRGEHEAFDAGFERALAEHVAGGHHE